MKAQYGVEFLFSTSVILLIVLFFSAYFIEDFGFFESERSVDFLEQDCLKLKMGLLSVFSQDSGLLIVSFSNELNFTFRASDYFSILEGEGFSYVCPIFLNKVYNTSFNQNFSFSNANVLNFEKLGGDVLLEKLS